jgi:hypothetical protein
MDFSICPEVPFVVQRCPIFSINYNSIWIGSTLAAKPTLSVVYLDAKQSETPISGKVLSL